MSPERFESHVRESLSAATESPDRRQDEVVLGAAREAAAEIRARRRGGARRLWWVPASMAAAAGMVAIGLWSTVERGEDVLRGTGGVSVVPGSGTTLTRPPARFDWDDQSGAAEYRLTLRTADARVLWQSPTSRDSHVSVPESVPFAPDATYLWTVQYEGPVTSGSLGPFSFRLATN